MSQHDPRPQVEMHAHAEGNAGVFQVDQGNLNVTIHEAGIQSPGASGVVEQLPPLVSAEESGFVGRGQHVVRLLDPAGSGPVTTVVSPVAGMGGVGKTALAAHVAGLAVGRGWFPGGAVIIDLHGYDPERRVVPGQVFAPMLHALGLDAAQVPARVDEQAAVYHRLLATRAEAGQRVLLVLDNASTADQVTGLLPRHSVHRVVVTSRHTLGDLDAPVLDLDVLDPSEAVDLVIRALRERDPGDERAVADREKAAELARVCGYLPLALRIAAALLADDPHLRAAELVEELADAHTRLDTLVYDGRAVAAAFDLSWQHLAQRNPRAARLFRLLPVNPGPDIAVGAAAVLVDLPVARVRPVLRALRRAHLIRPGAAPDRWGMHDLVRAYATGLPEDHTGERAGVTSRLLDHYTTTAQAADDHLRALPGQAAPDRFTGRDQALAWFDAERANLTAAVTLAAATGDHHNTVRLANCLAEYLPWRRYLDDWVTVATTARDAATHLDDPDLEGRAWNNLGLSLREVHRFDEAVTAHQRARDLHRQTGDQRREGDAWTNLGLALWEVRRFDDALAALHTAGDLYRQIGDRHREGMAWNDLGTVLREVGRFDEALAAHRTARDLYQQTGDQRRESDAWNNLGLALREVRRFDEAVAALRTAGDLYRRAGDRHREGMAWNNLGTVLLEVRRFDEAVAAHRTAVDLYQQTGDRHREAGAWNNLGLALAEVRRFDEALTAHRTAVDLCRQTGDLRREGDAWNNLGLALAEVRRFDEALTAHRHDLRICQQTGDRRSEGMAWNNLGLALARACRFEEAVAAHQTAIDVYQQTGNRHGEGDAWYNLGLALREVRRFDEAVTAEEHALAAFTQTGATDDADDARRILHDIQETSGRPDPEGRRQP